MNAIEVRSEIVSRMRRDLIGPTRPEDADLAREVLSGQGGGPSRWYLTGFLAPAHDGSPEVQDAIPEPEPDEEQTELIADTLAADDGDADPPVVRRRFLPSSIGITVMLPVDVTRITATATWGDYVTEPPLPPEILSGEVRDKRVVNWRRIPGEAVFDLPVPTTPGLTLHILPGTAAPGKAGGGLQLGVQAREVPHPAPGTDADAPGARVRVVTVFLINRRAPVTYPYADLTYIFQASLRLDCAGGFAPQYDLSRYKSDDADERLADLHYRDAPAYAVGLNVATTYATDADGRVRQVATDAMPRAAVERVEPAAVEAVLDMAMLAQMAAGDGTALVAALTPLVTAYRDWSLGQTAAAAADAGIAKAPRRSETAARLIQDQERAAARIAQGIALLRRDARARTAFAIMNRAIAMASDARGGRIYPWHPFQLAFILLNLPGTVDGAHADREVVDLLFFPTGGGKTEAYLGLAAFTIAHRRLGAAGLLGAGVSVVMRYTLRLLTLDQLGRAAGVVCALELLRTGDDYRDGTRPALGDWPIEIGLWVGSDASPNVLGKKGDRNEQSAVSRVRRYKSGKDKRAPAPLKTCPWCGTAFTPASFACVPNDLAPVNLELRCANAACAFTGDRALPILTVDEAIYRRLPAFLIATVDKFAALPWKGQAGAFFGHVDRCDTTGFYGAAEPGKGRRLDNGYRLDPPDLIVQDELHLISGPLGTIAGLYEAAIDKLGTRVVAGVRIRPKIVASTATVRRAAAQIDALFDRADTHIFPAPGIDRRDSFFAVTVPEADKAARWYVGLAASGRGPKLVFLRALTTLLAAAQQMTERHGAAADPYLTALCYFNALRELGGARRIVEDEVRAGASTYGAERRRVTPHDQPFADRAIGEPMELTSRVSTDDVAEAKRRLDVPFAPGPGCDGRVSKDEAVDVALATNMISVGLDISRLGLMLVQGQPKSAAEYIQATSRVGRDDARPGLVVAVLNLHKPRDRMHFEQFRHFHTTFYRAVEATSVTPWAARALDRALAAVVVAVARHVRPELSPAYAVAKLAAEPEIRAEVVAHLAGRAPADKKMEVEALVTALLDDWIAIAAEQTAAGGNFAYDLSASNRLLHAPLDKVLDDLGPRHRRFQAGWSMRDVEPAVRVHVRSPEGYTINGAGDLT